MAVSAPRRRYEDALKVSCRRHRRYRSKGEAAYALSWHLTCRKCRSGKVMDVFPCEAGPWWHIGHYWP